MKFKIYNTVCLVLILLVGTDLAVAQVSRSIDETDSLSSANQIIPVAYGTTTKQALTYSISTIGNKDIIRNAVFTPANALYGKLPGLTFLQNTSEPGNDEPSLFLRGQSTTKSSTPLILVDGIERALENVMLEDIENITVLKDAASSVIYGVRGANGVVLVTTKRGQEGRLKIAASAEQLFLSPSRIPEFLSSAEYVKLYNQALASDGLAPLFTPEQIRGYEAGNSFDYPNVDWYKEIAKDYTTGTKANLQVSGGDKKATYFVSLGYFKQNGIYKNTDMNEGYSTNLSVDNVSFRSNLNLNVNKNWSFRLDFSGRIYQNNSPRTATATLWEIVYKYPAHLFPTYAQDKVYGGTSIYPNNPIGYINSTGYRNINNRAIYTTLSTAYNFDDLLKGLSAGLSYSVDNSYVNNEGYTRDFAVREVVGKGADGKPLLSPSIGTNTNIMPFGPKDDIQARRNTFEGTIDYRPYIGENQTFSTQLIYHQDQRFTGTVSPYAYQFGAGRMNYSYLNRYFGEIGVSYSGTEAFPKGHRFGFFPAASAGWVISEEDFLKRHPAINFLRLRGSAGIVGNSAVDERFSDRRQYVTNDGYYFGSSNASQPGLYAGVIGNANFTWETAYKYEGGIDVTLFKELDLSLTGFFQKRKDILIAEDALVPGIFGGVLSNFNAGIVHNHGLEGSLGYRRQKDNLGYGIVFNASYVTNKLADFPEVAQPYDYLYKTGHPINQPFMLEAIGFFTSAQDIANSPLQTYGRVQPGDLKYKDQNGDGLIDAFDEVALNTGKLPNWDLGLNLSFNFKNFDINVFFQGQLGRSIYLGDEPLLFWPMNANNGKIATYAKEVWTEQTQATATYPRLSTLENKNNYRQSSFWYVNGDFLKMRSVDLGYNLPKRVIQYAKIRNARIFVRGMNLLTVDHLKYTDPEVLSGYPVMKSFSAGLNLQF